MSNARWQRTPTAFVHLVHLHSPLVLTALVAPYGLLEFAEYLAVMVGVYAYVSAGDWDRGLALASLIVVLH